MVGSGGGGGVVDSGGGGYVDSGGGAQRINAEILANFCTTRKTKKKWKKNPFYCDFLLIKKSIIMDSK